MALLALGPARISRRPTLVLDVAVEFLATEATFGAASRSGPMTRSFFRIHLPVLILLVSGGLMAMWLVTRAERETRADMVQKVQLLAQGMNARYLRTLDGTAADEAKPEYQRMKQQLQAVHTLYPNCRFIYLAGRKDDGSIYFFLDSEPAGTKDFSPPGQLYPEGSEVFRRVFDTKLATMEGPLTDRWGLWVTALAPVTDTATGGVLAVLGMDIDARLWNWRLARAALPAILLTLALAIIWITGAVLLNRRIRKKGAAPRWMRHVEPGLVVATGLSLSLAAMWFAYSSTSRHQAELFGNLADHQAGEFIERLQNVRDLQLEGLGRYYATRDYVTTQEFRDFTRSLTRAVSVTTWGWIPVVPAADRERFEAMARADELPEFEIWELDAQGNRVRAASRDVYYPVFQVAPGARIARVVGNDSGAEPRRLAALQEAMATRMTTATEPVTLASETGDQKGMVIYRPVYGPDRKLRGFVGASLRLENFLRFGVTPDRVPLVELALVHEGAPAESLAKTWTPAHPPASGRSLTRPVFAFGKAFTVTVHAGPEFGAAGPRWAGGLALVSGLMLTGTLATLVRFILRRRERLEQMVLERTAELRLSEESYRNQFANSSAIMLLINPAESTIIDANSTAVAFYGYPRERLVGMKVTEINPKTAAEMHQVLDSVVQGQRNRFEFQHRLADGSLRDVAISSSSIQYGGRTILHAIIQDITEQKQAQAKLRGSEEKFSKAFQANPSGLVITDFESGRFIEVNESFCELVRYSPGELIGRKSVELGIWGDADERRRVFKPLLDSGVLRNAPAQIYARDGTKKPILISGELVELNGKRCIVSMVADMTERERAAQELEAAHHDLQERIKELRCLYAITKLTGETGGSIGDLLKRATELIPSGWRFPEVARARITCDGEEFASPDFRVTPWIQSTDFMVAGLPAGKIEVCYLEERPEAEEGPFMKEERVLLRNLASQIGAAVERKRAEGKLHQLSSIIEQAPLSVVITNLDAIIEYVNPKFCAVTGFSRDELVGKDVRMLRSPETPPEVYQDMWAFTRSDRVWTGQTYSLKKNGESYLENVVAASLVDKDGRPRNYVTLKDDITAQKRFEEETKAKLAKEREVSDMKSQFISVASHEFRTPLAAAVGSLELLERHAAKLTEAKRLELLARIKTSLGRLTSIMDDVLQLSRADSGRVKVNRMNVDLPRFVQDIISQAEAGDRQQHRFVFERTGGPDAVPADTNLLNHVMSNLVGNAVRYSPAGTTIKVSLDIAAESFTFTVADEGIGVPEADREKVFEPFVRGSNVGQIGGTGLGLNIVKRYIELMGGRIDLLPAERGATFRVSIPLKQSPA
jgi:PAS domain S-box-containing protein